MTMVIWSGGQTGVDRAAWDAAIALGLEQDGWVPRGRLAEDGPMAKQYSCRETESADYAERTERNLREAEGTLILCFGRPTGGTLLTLNLCRKYKRPFLAVDLNKTNSAETLKSAKRFLEKLSPDTLNVAGPRTRNKDHVYDRSYAFLLNLLQEFAETVQPRLSIPKTS